MAQNRQRGSPRCLSGKMEVFYQGIVSRPLPIDEKIRYLAGGEKRAVLDGDVHAHKADRSAAVQHASVGADNPIRLILQVVHVARLRDVGAPVAVGGIAGGVVRHAGEQPTVEEAAWIFALWTDIELKNRVVRFDLLDLQMIEYGERVAAGQFPRLTLGDLRFHENRLLTV